MKTKKNRVDAFGNLALIAYSPCWGYVLLCRFSPLTAVFIEPGKNKSKWHFETLCEIGNIWLTGNKHQGLRRNCRQTTTNILKLSINTPAVKILNVEWKEPSYETNCQTVYCSFIANLSTKQCSEICNWKIKVRNLICVCKNVGREFSNERMLWTCFIRKCKINI